MNLRRVAALAATGVLASASIALFGVAPASAMPTGFAVVSGSVSESTSGDLMVLTQTTETAVIEFTDLQLNAGEGIDIQQPSDDSILVILADSVGFTGYISGGGTVIIVSEGNVTIGSSAFVGTDGDLIITTGTVDLSGLDDGAVDIEVVDADGTMSIILGAELAAEGAVGLIAPGITTGAEILGSSVVLASTESATYQQGSAPAIATAGAGLGAVTVGGTVISPSVLVTTPAPGTQSITGDILAQPQGDGSADLRLSGTGASDDLDAAAVVGGASPFSALGGYATQGPSTLPLTYSTVTASVDVVGGVPVESTAILVDVDVVESLAFSIIQTRCLVEDGLSAHVGIGGATFEDAPFVPADFDFSVPNQPGIPVSDTLTVSFNQQEFTTIGSYEVLTSTAVRFTGENDSMSFGVVSCAMPAADVLASTGSERMDAAALTGGAAVLLALAGVLLVHRRRRALP